MANFVSQELRTAMLKAYFNRDTPATTLYLRLFRSTAAFNEDTTLALLSGMNHEQRGTGYTAKVLSHNVLAAGQESDWTVSTVPNLGVRVTLKDQTWTTAEGVGWDDLQYAVLTDTPSFTGTILMVRDYGAGKTVTGIGATVTVDNLYYQINDIV